MANFSLDSFSKATNITSEEGGTADVLLVVNHESESNSNISLSCLTVSDTLTGLFGQPSSILWRISPLFGLSNSEKVENFHFPYLTALMVLASCVHLMLVTFKRLVRSNYIYHSILKNCNF
ncbi:hypothetical protein pdam_00005955 [Pocillopora damicornis]|uniref:Uncharacterized protein n=1 Tax=Pocillopora damicornis TaxID=46731 RepID=A0A3M6TDB8_POCDA|nr:hypothetical protein pdam_00005955 [Pocillopora damicornis]